MTLSPPKAALGHRHRRPRRRHAGPARRRRRRRLRRRHHRHRRPPEQRRHRQEDQEQRRHRRRRSRRTPSPARRSRTAPSPTPTWSTEERSRPATLSNGGEGDCVWHRRRHAPGAQRRGPDLPQGPVRESSTWPVSRSPSTARAATATATPATRVRSRTRIAFILPAGYIPAKTHVQPPPRRASSREPRARTPARGLIPPGRGLSAAAVLLDGITLRRGRVRRRDRQGHGVGPVRRSRR